MRGEKKKIGSQNCKKNLLDDLPGVKISKEWVKMAKKHTRGKFLGLGDTLPPL